MLAAALFVNVIKSITYENLEKTEKNICLCIAISRLIRRFVLQNQTTMTLQQLENEKQELLAKANNLSAQYKTLYSNMNIESPMSTEEKAMKNEIASLFARVNQIVAEKRKLAKA